MWDIGNCSWMDPIRKPAHKSPRVVFSSVISSRRITRIAEMDAAGITIQVLSAVGAGADSREGDDGLELARSYNAGLEKLVSAHPQRYRGFAHIPLRSAQAAADELERAMWITHSVP